jgi:uncharacterized protein YjiS (DUF1127 family)
MLANLIAASAGLPAPARHPARFLRLVSGAAKSVLRWLERRRQLRALCDLDDYLLRDIGLSREDVERACSAPFWIGDLTKPRHPLRPAFLLCGLLIAASAGQAVSQEICKPSLSPKASGHSDVVSFQRRWTGVFAVDASRCSAAAGPFEIEFVRLKDSGPDLPFKERFTWRPDQVEVSLDLSWDEWVNAYRISDVAPCPCRN